MDEHASSDVGSRVLPDAGGPPARPRVIYVMGAGRSGSTILGVALGNCPEVFYAGELDAWLSRGGRSQLDGAERTAFWERVLAQMDDARELFGRDAELSLERSLSILRVHRWRSRRRLRGAYRRVAAHLFEVLTDEADGRAIVDTSHYPLRARELQALSSLDLYLVYLMRDPQSVVHSFNRTDVAQYRKSTLTTNVYLWLTNLLAVLVFLRQPRERRLVVRYEDLVADPPAVLSDVLALAGLSQLPPDLAALRTGVAFQGNRLIREQVIELRRQPGPAPSVPRRSAITTVAQWPWTAILSRLRPVAGAAGR